MRRAEYNDLALKKLPIRRLFAGLAIALGIAALAIGGLSLPWHGRRPAEPARLLASSGGSGPLRAGAASREIALAPGAPIGGFARADWTSAGVRHPVSARALYLEVPGCRAVIVSAELLLITEPLAREVQRRVADLGLSAVLVGATHTHAGPGGYWDDAFVERIGLGPYDARILAAITDAIVAAIRGAAAAAAPARVAVARGLAEGLVRSRSHGRLDARMLSLRIAGADGSPLAELLIFAAHPTTLGKGNRFISGDWPGRLGATPERGLRLVLQGAIGDQSARIYGDRPTRPDRYAALVEQADRGLAPSEPFQDATLAVASAAVTLPELSPGGVPAWLRRAVATVAWGSLPATATVTALKLGPIRLIAVPAEPTAEIAEGWRSAAGPGSDIVSLVGGYVGYVDTPERTRSGDGEAVRTYYGPELAARLESAVVAASRALAP
jgi:hypothetical protein